MKNDKQLPDNPLLDPSAAKQFLDNFRSSVGPLHNYADVLNAIPQRDSLFTKWELTLVPEWELTLGLMEDLRADIAALRDSSFSGRVSGGAQRRVPGQNAYHFYCHNCTRKITMDARPRRLNFLSFRDEDAKDNHYILCCVCFDIIFVRRGIPVSHLNFLQSSSIMRGISQAPPVNPEQQDNSCLFVCLALAEIMCYANTDHCFQAPKYGAEAKAKIQSFSALLFSLAALITLIQERQ